MTTIDYPAALIAADALRRARERVRPSTPAALAKRLDPDYRIVPAIAVISDVLDDAIRNPDRRYVIAAPPRTGKSYLCSVVAPVFALMLDPDAQVMCKSYGDSLAQDHSGQARRLIVEHSALLGFDLDQSKSAVDRWRVDGRRGGMLAGGMRSPATGFGAHLLLCDDPHQGVTEADSRAHRERVVSTFRTDLMSRLMPGGSAVVLATRWHEKDVSGVLLDEPGTPWVSVNLPAVATAGVPDTLGRVEGAVLTSAVGFTAADYTERKQSVGARAWAANYLGVPAAPEGSIVQAEWIERHRLPAAPPRSTRIVIGVDPADSGKGDQTGIVAVSLAPNGTAAIIADASGHMTSDEWSRRAADLAADLGASLIAVEGFAAATTYTRLVSDAVRDRLGVGHHVSVVAWPPKGQPRKGDALARSQALIVGLEVGTAAIAGHLPDLEDAMLTWQQGQHQPDAVTAAQVAHDALRYYSGRQTTIAAPVGTMSGGHQSAAAGPRVVGARPELDAIVAASAARNRAVEAGRDPDTESEVLRAHEMVRRTQQWGRALR
ncbi:terminase large subunit domain-containing protein [Rhodococcus zopfii]